MQTHYDVLTNLHVPSSAEHSLRSATLGCFYLVLPLAGSFISINRYIQTIKIYEKLSITELYVRVCSSGLRLWKVALSLMFPSLPCESGG